MKIANTGIFPFDPTDATRSSYDWAIGSVGYESRARHFFETIPCASACREVFVFTTQHVIAFEQNRKSFHARGFSELQAHDDPIIDAKTVRDLLRRIEEYAVAKSLAAISLVVDISSMTRQLIALLCFGFAETSGRLGINIRCDFVYCLAKFGDLPALNGPIVSNGPIITKLAGWGSNPSSPCGLVMGIGYEEDLALGVIEELEPGAVWAFRPRNIDQNYDLAINKHNRGLFDIISTRNLVRYSPRDPYALFVALDQLSTLSKSDFRVLILPFGPKIFALAACLVGVVNYPEIGVWRVSAGPNLKPVDREPCTPLVGLRVEFRASE